MNFPERLILLRQENSLTQVDLANLVQISRSALSLYELGKREPDFSILSKLAQFFGVTTDYLLGITDKPDQANPISDTQNAVSPSLSPKDIVNSVIGSRLKKARDKKGLNQKEAAESFGISNVVLNRYENDERTPDVETLGRLAEFYGVTTDYLLGRTDKTSHPNSLSPKEERDIAKDLEKILSNLESDEALAYNGEPMDDETKELMKISLENSMRLAKQLAKKKFTPGKYK